MISFIMMAKNEEKFISSAIHALQKENSIKWELIVIDDHSTDSTFQIVRKMSKSDLRIKVEKNKYYGKVLGTNYGYTLTSGDIIKCIDADDILSENFFSYYEQLTLYDAHYHDALIVDEELKVIARQVLGQEFQNRELIDIVSNIRTLPKAYWSYKRSIADKIFPMPEDLPVEDEWISFVIKRHSKSLLYIPHALYLYRQNNGQDYGGILNYGFENVAFRARRLIKVIDVVNKKMFANKLDIQATLNFLELQTRQSSIITILRASIPVKYKAKLIIILKFPNLASNLLKARLWLQRK